MMNEFRRLPNEIDELLSQPDIEGTYKITLVFNPPPGMGEFEKELEKLQIDPQFIFAYANDN